MPLYTITNTDPASPGHGRVYVGSCTISLYRRMARHYYLGDHATDASPDLYRDMHATLKRARATREWAGETTTDILKAFYKTELAQGVPGINPVMLKNCEQSLLEKTAQLSLLPCYNVRRPVAQPKPDQTPESAEETRARRKAAYHTNKTMCSCGRMVSKGNRSHAKSAVHARGGKASPTKTS